MTYTIARASLLVMRPLFLVTFHIRDTLFHLVYGHKVVMLVLKFFDPRLCITIETGGRETLQPIISTIFKSS